MKKIKEFFNCVWYTWICKMYLAIIIAIVTSTYIGQVIDTKLEYTWYSETIMWLLYVSAMYLLLFFLVMFGFAIRNIFKKKK